MKIFFAFFFLINSFLAYMSLENSNIAGAMGASFGIGVSLIGIVHNIIFGE